MKLQQLETRATSGAFATWGKIPRRHAWRGEGQNISPPLAWPAPPEGTVEQVLICDDPDAPRTEPWVHWLLYGLGPEVTALEEGLPPATTLTRPPGARQGLNSWGDAGWGGPFPPRGHGVHHYRFRIWALDRRLELPPGAGRAQVERAMRGHVLGQAELVGTYER